MKKNDVQAASPEKPAVKKGDVLFTIGPVTFYKGPASGLKRQEIIDRMKKESIMKLAKND